ncbi:hypothetical protein FRB98_005909 [Tulasnella sp. 332]|nr:hypothetical protein FRB98_005909 [Tulasnella sp. 332]
MTSSHDPHDISSASALYDSPFSSQRSRHEDDDLNSKCENIRTLGFQEKTQETLGGARETYEFTDDNSSLNLHFPDLEYPRPQGTDDNGSEENNVHVGQRPEHPTRFHPPPVRTTVVRIACWVAFGLVVGVLPATTLISLIPFFNILTIPLFALLTLAVFFLTPRLAYLSLAQTDPPEHVPLPFLPSPWDLNLGLQINVLVYKWILIAFRIIPLVIVDWCVMRVIEAKDTSNLHDESVRQVKRDIPYDSTHGEHKLDVYGAHRLADGKHEIRQTIPLSRAFQTVARTPIMIHDPSPLLESAVASPTTITSIVAGLSPIIIFIPSPHVGPMTSSKWMFESLGRNLAAMGYTVVIPNVTRYPDGKTKEMVGDVRKVMSLGGHLALLTVIQEAVVHSRESILARDGDDGQMSNGLRKLRIYEHEVKIPRVAGMVLLAPICDVNEQIVQEARRGAAHLSKLRRILGPSHTTAMFHSPAHILHASRNVVNVSLLPPKVLFIHGGLDEEVHHSQSEMMKEMMRGVGIKDAKCRVYPMGHMEAVTGATFILQATYIFRA